MTYSVNNTSPYRGFRKSSAYGLLGTTLSCLVLFLIMWFYIMPYTQYIVVYGIIHTYTKYCLGYQTKYLVHGMIYKVYSRI